MQPQAGGTRKKSTVSRPKLDRVDLLSRFLALGTRHVSRRGFELFFRKKQSGQNANSGGVG